MTDRPHSQTLSLLAAYAACGALHELAHLAAAAYLLPPGAIGIDSAGDLVRAALRAVLGRYSVVELPSEEDRDEAAAAILRAGWMFSLLLAAGCHWLHVVAREGGGAKCIGRKQSHIVDIFRHPTLPLAAYVTAIEAIATDLFGLVPIHPYYQDASRLVCFCGNFGVLLLNPSWLSIDGGRTALDVLEKMVNVTMMRGAQSGGVVTFEPERYSGNDKPASVPPPMRGVRSRVVNAKRTDLSKGVRRKVVKDNCERISGNLRGWDKSEYNINLGGGRLVRGFFGHTVSTSDEILLLPKALQSAMHSPSIYFICACSALPRRPRRASMARTRIDGRRGGRTTCIPLCHPPHPTPALGRDVLA